MCPACVASAALLIASVMSMGGLTAVVMKKLGGKTGAKESVQKSNSKEEAWEK
jgi:hypothetical protein